MPSSACDLNTPLAEILTESADAVREREASALDTLLKACNNRCVVFGCGGLGRRAIEKLTGLGVRPLALCDNNRSLWATEIEGIPVVSVNQAAAQFGEDSLFLIAVWNPHHWYGETAQQLKAAGVRSITSYLPLFWRFPNDFLPVVLLNDLPAKVYEAKEDVLAAERYWADDLSLRIYRANIHWRAMGNPESMPPRPDENTYLPKDIFAPVNEECILDCGAYDGDTVRQFLNRYGQNFAAIYPIEGDAVSFERLQKYIGTLPPTTARKIHPTHCAVGAMRAIVRFGFDGVTGSKAGHADSASIDVPCYPLDDLPITEPVTMIKMDIEGAEYDGLLGARRLTQRDKPILAICVYHRQNDIWRIPLLVRDLLPQHKLYLRSYEGDGFQTVLYAVPPDRALA
jgi:FkbM family methyltransferase